VFWRLSLDSTTEWNHRYEQQAKWTSDLRYYLYQEAKIKKGDRVIDVGCGTGVLIRELTKLGAYTYGLDVDWPSLLYASEAIKNQLMIQGDAHNIPSGNDFFDISLCHFVLLWLTNPEMCLKEMIRVTKPGGKVLALAEPDYGGRLDYPEHLSILGRLQTSSLLKQGANPNLGRQLVGMFNKVGLSSVQTGILGGQWSTKPDWKNWELEWQVLESDWYADKSLVDETELFMLKETDRNACENGQRVLFVPTFYAWGVVE
jgi:SAM-dependent methyltransferase